MTTINLRTLAIAKNALDDMLIEEMDRLGKQDPKLSTDEIEKSAVENVIHILQIAIKQFEGLKRKLEN